MGIVGEGKAGVISEVSTHSNESFSIVCPFLQLWQLANDESPIMEKRPNNRNCARRRLLISISFIGNIFFFDNTTNP
jgi:hypothetical protein